MTKHSLKVQASKRRLKFGSYIRLSKITSHQAIRNQSQNFWMFQTKAWNTL